LVAIDPKNAIVLSCGAGLAGLYGDFDLGNELSKAAVEADPKQPKAWNVRGEIQFNRAKYPEAVEAFTKAIEFGSGDSLAQRYYMRGMSYSRLEQRLAFAKLALDDLETARKLNDRADWMFAHTTILYETLRMEDALTLLNAYIERMPDDPQGAVMRAMTLIVLERPEDADKEFSRLKNLDSKRAEQEPMFRKSAEDARGEYAKLKKLAEDPAQLLKLLEPNNRPKK
jgi:tetratricopeptide (TPR) repeat protein